MFDTNTLKGCWTQVAFNLQTNSNFRQHFMIHNSAVTLPPPPNPHVI